MEELNGRTQVVVKDEISLKQLLRSAKEWWNYLGRRRMKILVFGVVGSAIGLAYSLVTSPAYIASTSFVLENTKKGLGDYSSIAAKFGFSSGSGGGLFQDDQNIIMFMKSRTMISQTLYSEAEFNGVRQLIVERYMKMHNYADAWSAKPNLKGLQFHTDPTRRTLLEDSLMGVFCKDILKDNLNVGKPNKEEDLIVASTISSDELFSKSFNENLLENVIDFYISGQTQRSQENVNILQRQTDSVRGLLNSALSNVAITSEANPNPNPAMQRLKVPSQKRMVDVEMNKAILEELVKNLELAKISLRKEMPLVQIIDRPVLPLEKKKIGKLKGLVFGFAILVFISAVFYSFSFAFHKILSEEK